MLNCFIQEQTEEFSLSCCLHREHYVNSGMCRRSECRGCTTSHCCYCYDVPLTGHEADWPVPHSHNSTYWHRPLPAYINAIFIARRDQLSWTTTHLNSSATMHNTGEVRGGVCLSKRHKLLAHHWQDFSNAWMQLHAILAELRYRCTDFLSGCRCLISDIYIGLSLVFSLLICPAIAYSHCTGDTLHWLVWNLAQGSWPMVCSFLPNFSFVILLFCWALLYSTLCLAVLRDTWKVMLSYVQSVWCPCRYICIYIVWTWVY